MAELELFSFLYVALLLRNKAGEPLPELECKGKASSAITGFGAETFRMGLKLSLSHPYPSQWDSVEGLCQS